MSNFYMTLIPLMMLVGSLGAVPHAQAAPGEERKFNPGHYVALHRYADGPAAIADSLRPGVRGIQKRYAWSELEPAKDRYDFSEIEHDLSLLRDTGRQLVVFIFDKSFKDFPYTPDYLQPDYTVPLKSVATGTGYVSKRWDPYVVERFGKLVDALSRAFDDHPGFEGIAIQETALGVEDAILEAESYTPEKYRDALIAQLGHAAGSLRRSQVFWYANFFPQGQHMLAEVAEAVAPLGVAVGGPDVLPDRDSLERHVYPFLKAQPDDVLIFNSVQNDSYHHLHDEPAATKYWTPKELLEFARDELDVEYLFWNRVPNARPEDAYDIEDAYPVMAANPLDQHGDRISPLAPAMAR